MNIPRFPLPLQGLRFKGARDYLHGTDVLPAALEAVLSARPSAAIRDIDITFHALARTGLSLRAEAPSGREAEAQLACTVGGDRLRLYLVGDGRPVVERVPYPEDVIVATTDIDAVARTATSKVHLPFTNIERWIAMTKALHHEVHPDADGKWLFVRGRFHEYVDRHDKTVEYRLCIQSDFGGKLTRTTLRVDGSDWGEIFFALA